MLAHLLRFLQGNPEAHDLTQGGSGVTPYSLAEVLDRPIPKGLTDTERALYPKVALARCAHCGLLVTPGELRAQKPRAGWCGLCLATWKDEQRARRTHLAEELRQAEERKDEELRLAEAQHLVVRMPERGRS